MDRDGAPHNAMGRRESHQAREVANGIGRPTLDCEALKALVAVDLDVDLARFRVAHDLADPAHKRLVVPRWVFGIGPAFVLGCWNEHEVANAGLTSVLKRR